MKIGKYEVTVDRNLCIGAGTCVAVSPNIFELDGEKKAVFKAMPAGRQEGGEDNEVNVLMAAQSCPVKAVIITDETGKQVWPV